MKKIIIGLLVIMLMLSGCQTKEGRNSKDVTETQTIEKAKNTYNYFKNIKLKENQLFLYNAYYQKLGIYNTKTYSWTPLYEDTDVFTYRIQGDSSIYTIGKYSLQGTTQGRYLTGGVPPVRFSM